MSAITDSPGPGEHPPARVAGIILAAGLSSRMGQCKALLPLDNRPVLSHVIDQASACGPPVLDPLVVVLGAHASEIRSRIEFGSTVPVENPDYASGMAGSIKAGLDYIARADRASSPGSPCTGALFILGDQPRIPARIFTRLVRASSSHPDHILVPVFNGTAGNPVLFGARFFPELGKLSGDVGGRALFPRYPEALRHISVSDPGICQDLDTWADYQAMAGEAKP